MLAERWPERVTLPGCRDQPAANVLRGRILTAHNSGRAKVAFSMPECNNADVLIHS
ncbi:hypothetical protein P3T16_005840 [Paraburkholderia sp. GAS42]